MAPKVKVRRAPVLQPETLSEFRPGNVVTVLGLGGIDYRQLRRLAKVACPNAVKDGSWGRYSFRDMVALRAAFELAGGMDAIKAGRRLSIQRVRQTVDAARRRFGVDDPLVQLKLSLHGRRVVASYRGVVLEPATGQLEMVYAATLERTEVASLTKSELRRHLRSIGAPIEAKQRLLSARRDRRGAWTL